MQWCTANALLSVSNNHLEEDSSFTLWASQLIRLVHLFVSCDTVAFRHCVLGKSCLWLFLLGPAPFAFCFASLLDGEAHIWLGDLRFALCGLGLLFLLCCDLPTYMTTGVHVDVILTCFFSCKDRASERYRPHQREKKSACGKKALASL